MQTAVPAAALAALASQEGQRSITESEWQAAENTLKSMFSQKNIGQVATDFKQGLLFSGEVLDVLSSWGIVVPAGFLIKDYIANNAGSNADKNKGK